MTVFVRYPLVRDESGSFDEAMMQAEENAFFLEGMPVFLCAIGPDPGDDNSGGCTNDPGSDDPTTDD